MTRGRAAIRRPVILLGAPRSGTSLLAELFDAHPAVAVLREPRLVWRFGNDRRSDQLRPQHATPRVIEHIHGAFADALDQRAGASRIVEKTPANAVRPRFVDTVFPDAIYVHITRDGWAAVPSLRTFWERRGTGLDARQLAKARRRMSEASPRQWPHYAREAARRVAGGGRRTPLYGPRLTGLQAAVDELGRLEAAAMQWRECVYQVTAFGREVGPERYTELRLETLDVTALDDVLAFCDLAPAPSVRERFTSLFEATAASRRPDLAEDERTLIAPYVEPANAWLGYPSLRPSVETPTA